MNKISIFSKLPYVLILGGFFGNAAFAEVNSSLEANAKTGKVDQQPSLATTKDNEIGLLNYIPKIVDSTPTIFPEQSNQVIVPPTDATEDQTWADKKQKKISNWADRTANKMDNWFGKTDPAHPASATLRIIVDNQWNKHDGYDVNPRIRGKVKLPTLEKYRLNWA